MRSNSRGTASSSSAVSFSMMQAPCPGFSFLWQRPLALDDALDSHGAAYRFFPPALQVRYKNAPSAEPQAASGPGVCNSEVKEEALQGRGTRAIACTRPAGCAAPSRAAQRLVPRTRNQQKTPAHSSRYFDPPCPCTPAHSSAHRTQTSASSRHTPSCRPGSANPLPHQPSSH